MAGRKRSFRQRFLVASILAILAQTIMPFTIGTAQAVTPTFSYIFVSPDRMAPNVFTSGTICASYSAANASAGTETTVRVTFPTGYTVSTTAANWTVNSTSASDWPSGAVAWPGIAQPTNAPSGQTVDFISTDISSSGIYCFNWTDSTAALKTKTTSGNSLTGSVTVRSGTYPGTADLVSSNYALSVIGASTSADQVTVTATVPPSFVFVLSGNSQAFTTNLDPASTVSTGTLTATVTTNAASGYVIYVKDLKFKGSGFTETGSNPAGRHGSLESATAGNYEISNNGNNTLGTAAFTLTNGVENYGFAVTAVTQGGGGQAGTGAANAAYDSTSGTKIGTLDPTGYRPFASSGGTSNGDVYTFLERATIAGITPAATDYTDTLTIVAAGKF